LFQIDVRHAAAQLMGYILEAMDTREFGSNEMTIQNLVVQVTRGLESILVPVLHGSLLGLREFFLYADKVSRFLHKAHHLT
jgi:hypothetical protein